MRACLIGTFKRLREGVFRLGLDLGLGESLNLQYLSFSEIFSDSMDDEQYLYWFCAIAIDHFINIVWLVR